jgi:glyoxylase-like metal-dependent hydrolase (beta-lactamase superfamily II)
MEFEVFETPGHSTGHVVFLNRNQSPGLAFVGDVIMQGSTGRTDFPGGSDVELYRSISQILFSWPDETVLLSGHGPATTVGEEKRYNLVVAGLAQRFGR